jgi:lipid II:glycine glycyltransferase (peptidoglycan interpeptide bridge formation enzyme)
MSNRTTRELAAGYTSEVDTVDERTWCQILQEFDDANIYQTWPYAAVICGARNMSHLVLRLNGDIAAIAQARITKLPLVNLGIAYVQWGPIWRRSAVEAREETFRQAVRALRNEFVCKRGLALRLFPIVFDDLSSHFSEILAEEGFSSLGQEAHGRTILMDLKPPLEDLRQGMQSHWKRELKIAERNSLVVTEGSDDSLFGSFVDIYREMVSRKRFVEPNDINQFRLIQSRLPEKLKMKIMLGASGGQVSSGLICSMIGDTAIYLFGATSNSGLKSRGSYLLQWKLIETLKQNRAAVYNLNGINPTKNPGTFKFKSDLAGKNGKDVYYVGRFDSHSGFISRVGVDFGDTLRMAYRKLKERAKTSRDAKSSLKVENGEPGGREVARAPILSQVQVSIRAPQDWR